MTEPTEPIRLKIQAEIPTATRERLNAYVRDNKPHASIWRVLDAALTEWLDAREREHAGSAHVD